MRRAIQLMAATALVVLTLVPCAHAQQTSLSPIERLGKSLFFDKNLSKNRNQSCATCHDPSVGYTGPNSSVNAHGAVYAGSQSALFGNRKPPSAAYAGDSPMLHYDGDTMSWAGGMFWDGRADGSVLADPLAEQAKGPFLNPLEMALDSAEVLCGRVSAATYRALFEQVWGAGSLNCSDAAGVYDLIGVSIAAYERSAEVNPYTSKFDLFWDRAKVKKLEVSGISTSNWATYRNLGLNDTELFGLALFNGPTQANCASCHSLKAGSRGYPLFTDYGYDNLGVPKNSENPFYKNLAYNPEGSGWVDYGIGGYLAALDPQSGAEERGKMKVPTLRNVDKRPSSTFVKAYFHNGSVKSLSDVIRFYASRSMMTTGGGCMGGGRMGGGGMGGMCGGMMFPEPEVNENLASLNHFRCADQSYLLAFLKTLSDGYFRR